MERSPERLGAVPNILARQPWDRLRPLIALGHVDPEAAISKLKAFVQLALEWNRSVSNLVSRNDESRIVSRHVRESIEPIAFLNERPEDRWIDFGSGAGFPAIPLAILGIGTQWTLVESRRPKTLFLRKLVEVLELSQIEIYHGRLETFVEERAREKFDALSSRATMRVAPTLELASAIIRDGGLAYLWKGSRREEELKDTSSWSATWIPDGVQEIGEETIAVARFVRTGG